jgi:hypothetical protein
MKTLASITAIAALVGGMAVAQAQTSKQGGAPGDPPESGQSAERNRMGAPGGSATNPSPMAPRTWTSGTTGAGPKDTSKGQPPEQNQEAERNPSGRPAGSVPNPSPPR